MTCDSIVIVPDFRQSGNCSMDRLDFLFTVTEHPIVIDVHQDAEYEDIEDLVKAGIVEK